MEKNTAGKVISSTKYFTSTHYGTGSDAKSDRPISVVGVPPGIKGMSARAQRR